MNVSRTQPSNLDKTIGSPLTLLVCALLVAAGWYLICVLLTPLGTGEYARQALQTRDLLLIVGFALDLIVTGGGVVVVMWRLIRDTQ